MLELQSAHSCLMEQWQDVDFLLNLPFVAMVSSQNHNLLADIQVVHAIGCSLS